MEEHMAHQSASRLLRAALACAAVIAASALALGAAGAPGALAAEDIKVTYATKAKSLLGGMGDNGAETEYHSERYKLTVKERGRDELIDYLGLARYEIDHRKKTIEKTSLADESEWMRLLAESAQAKLDAGRDKDRGVRWMKRHFKSLEGDLSVETLGTETVAGRSCERWRITLGEKFSHQAWIDPSLTQPAPPDALEAAAEAFAGDMQLLPMAASTYGRFAKEVSKLRGIELKEDWKMPFWIFTFRQTREATKVELGPIPASVFELPAGYEVRDVGRELLERQRQRMAEGK
jgi:hypothetical protein